MKNSAANNRQPGGDHYKGRKIQHWDYATRNNHGYLQGQISKYVFRWRDKGGALDLEKAEHFLEKLTEIHYEESPPITLMGFLSANNIIGDEALVIMSIHLYEETSHPEYLSLAKETLARLRQYAAAYDGQ